MYRQGGIVRGNPEEKKICLVFTAHDKADGADHIISTLAKHKVKGAFFFTGNFFQSFPKVVRRLIADGHYVGSHSFGHLLYASWEKPDSTLVSKEEFTADMLKSFRQMAKFGIQPKDAPFFIPPYEHYNAEVASWAQQLGLQIVNFTPGTASSQDYTWRGMTGEKEKYRTSQWLYNNIMQCESRHTLNGHLLMIHLGTDDRRTDKFYHYLHRLITNLQAKGYAFVSLNELLTASSPK